MADEKAPTQEYVLLSDGCRHEGKRYSKGDPIHLDDETAERLLASGSVRLPGDDDPEIDLSGQAGMAPVAAEASSTGAAQSLEADGETIKESSFGHPDQVEAAEAAADKAAARRKPAGTKTASEDKTADDGKPPAATGPARAAASKA